MIATDHDGQLAALGDDESLPAAICIVQPDWHQGIVGLLASRVKERVHRPVIAFAPASDTGEELKGSARSIPGVHIRDNCLVDGKFDVTTFNPLTRLGYRDYSTIREVFSLQRPGE